MDETINEVSSLVPLTIEPESVCADPLTSAVGYVRVSGKAQSDGDGPVRQRASIEEFSSRNALRLHQFFSDLGVSGTIEGLDRPALVQMLDFMQEYGVSVLLVEKMDRLARDLMVSELLIRELRMRKIKLYSVEQGMVDLCTDESDPGRVFVRQVFGAVAEYEKSALVLKLRGSRERIRRMGGRCEGRLPYGQNRREVLTLETIKTMRDGAKASWASIAKALTTSGFVKRNGNKYWNGSEVCGLYKNWETRRRKEEDAKRAANSTRDGSRGAGPCPSIPPSGEANIGGLSFRAFDQLGSAQGLSPAPSGVAESPAE